MSAAADCVYDHLRVYQGGRYASDSMPARLCRYFMRTELGQWMIRDVHAAVIPMHANEVQLRVLVKMLDQAARGQPIRLCILKSRKTGVTTETETLGCDLCAWEENQKALTIAHAEEPTKEIFDIAKLAAECHSRVRPCDVTAELKWPDTRSHYVAMTAGGTAVGAGGTPSFLHTSEGPKWEKNKEATYYNAVNSVPYVPETIIIHEFTAKGRELFFNLFDAASDPNHPYERIFIAWYLDSTLVAEVPEGFEADEEERRLCGRAHAEGIELSNAQLCWRRNKILEIGEALFRQEYPSTPEEAIQGNKGLIFPNMREALVAELPFNPGEVPESERVGGIDFGYNDPTVIWSGFYRDQVLWVTDFWRKTESLAADQLDALHVGHTYFCDPANVTERISLGRASDAAGKRCRFASAPRRKSPGEEVDRVELEHIVTLLRQSRLKILYKIAPQLIVETDTLAWDEKTGKPDLRRGEAVAHYDSVFALKYLVMGIVERPVSKPVDHERRLSRHAEYAAGW